MLIREIRLENLLSFGPESPALSLRPLNVLIGPNGSGKSNLIEAISLLQAAPTELARPLRAEGVREWLWKGAGVPIATIEAIIENLRGTMPLRHRLSFRESGRRFDLADEAIENEKPHQGHRKVYFYYRYQRGRPVLNSPPPDHPATKKGADGEKGRKRMLSRESIDPEKSILAQRKDPDAYPEITFLGEQYARIKIYTDWRFGRSSPMRRPQPPHERSDYLLEDCSNLSLVLNRLRTRIKVKKQILEDLESLYAGITDFDVAIQDGSVQLYLQEGDFTIPSSRLSDGTLRFLCLVRSCVIPSHRR